MEKLLALTLKAAKDLHKVNGKAMITFESPKHGSFKSNAQVQAMLRIEGFWLVELDYCAMADETLDGAVYGPAGNRQGGVQPKKSTVVLTFAASFNPQECPQIVRVSQGETTSSSAMFRVITRGCSCSHYPTLTLLSTKWAKSFQLESFGLVGITEVKGTSVIEKETKSVRRRRIFGRHF